MRGPLLGWLVFVLAVAGGYLYGRARKAQKQAAQDSLPVLAAPKPIDLRVPIIPKNSVPRDLPSDRDGHRGSGMPRVER
jgi:hypothetical protein